MFKYKGKENMYSQHSTTHPSRALSFAKKPDMSAKEPYIFPADPHIPGRSIHIRK